MNALFLSESDTFSFKCTLNTTRRHVNNLVLVGRNILKRKHSALQWIKYSSAMLIYSLHPHSAGSDVMCTLVF